MSNTRYWSLMVGLLALALLGAGCGSLTQAPPTTTPLPPTPTPIVEGLVDIGGRSLSISCAGGGSPTVILEASEMDQSAVWSGVRDRVSGFTRACYYDRAGVALSDPRPTTPATAQDVVDDLHALLTAANIGGPYILVGNFMGGMSNRVYASQYPEDIVGMVLVEVQHPEMPHRLLAALPAEAATEGHDLYGFRQFVLSVLDHVPYGPEALVFETFADQVEATGTLGSMPLVVLTHDPAESGEVWPPTFRERADVEWTKMQEELATLSSNSALFIVEGGGNYLILQDKPQAVADAILSVLAQVRGEQE